MINPGAGWEEIRRPGPATDLELALWSRGECRFSRHPTPTPQAA